MRSPHRKAKISKAPVRESRESAMPTSSEVVRSFQSDVPGRMGVGFLAPGPRSGTGEGPHAPHASDAIRKRRGARFGTTRGQRKV
jgi:hypothetical protein